MLVGRPEQGGNGNSQRRSQMHRARVVREEHAGARQHTSQRRQIRSSDDVRHRSTIRERRFDFLSDWGVGETADDHRLKAIIGEGSRDRRERPWRPLLGGPKRRAGCNDGDRPPTVPAGFLEQTRGGSAGVGRHVQMRLGAFAGKPQRVDQPLIGIHLVRARRRRIHGARQQRAATIGAIAAAFTDAEFNADRVTAALANRTRATEVLNVDLLAATRRIFELLNEEQRREFAYLLRSGAFVL